MSVPCSFVAVSVAWRKDIYSDTISSFFVDRLSNIYYTQTNLSRYQIFCRIMSKMKKMILLIDDNVISRIYPIWIPLKNI